MKTKRLSASLVCIFVFFLITAAHAAPPVSVLECPQGPPTPGLTPQYGGILKVIYTRGTGNLGIPWKAQNPGGDKPANRFAIENLVGLNPKGHPCPQLATGWKNDIANKTITFTLRKGVKFHDGTDFNANAVKYCMDKYREGPLPDLDTVTSVDVIDDYTVRLTLSEWDPLLIQSLSWTGAGDIVSPTAAEKLGDDLKTTPVGTGPFKFVSYKPHVSLVYERFDDYWQKGLPYLDRVELLFVADPMVATTSFLRGEAHMVTNISTIDAKNLKSKGNILIQRISAITCISGDSKNPDSPFADIRIRRAIAHGLDNEAIGNAINSLNTPTRQLAVPGFTAYSPDIKGYPYDPEKAKALLKAAGYDARNPLTIPVMFMTPTFNDLYTMIQSYLREVNINLQLKPVERSAMQSITLAGWKNCLMDHGCSYNGIEVQYSTTLMINLSEGQSNYVSVWTPDDYNKLFKTMLVESDLNKREEYYKQLNKMAIDDYCLVIPVWLGKNTCCHVPELHDFGMYTITVAEFLPERAWLEQ